MKDPIVLSVGMAKFILAGLVTLGFRLVTPILGLPNVSPLMATGLAGSKAYGPWISGAYCFIGMIALDLCMRAFDPVRTLVTAACYATVCIGFSLATDRKRVALKHYLIASAIGTLFFDAVTGCIMSPLLYDMPWAQAFIGQIPFTAKHLVGNLAFAALAPWFELVFRSTRLEFKLMGMAHGQA